MSTLVEMVANYTKKHGVSCESVDYTHTYPDGSTETFTIETAEKEVRLYDPDDRDWYQAVVPTRRFRVTARGSMGTLDWFHGERTFGTVEAAIKAIKKDVKDKEGA
jgi:hypothetical protein